MRRRNLDAGSAVPSSHPTLEADFMNKAARDASDPEKKAERAQAQADANLAELLKPFSHSLDLNKNQPNLLRTQGKELLQFVFAARGLTKSGKPEDLYAGRKALAAAEALLGRYQMALAEAKEAPLNAGSDFVYDKDKSSTLTKTIRTIVPKAFNPSDFWRGKPFGTSPTQSRVKISPAPASLTPSNRAELAKKKTPLRLEDKIEPLPDSNIEPLEEGPPPVHDEISSLTSLETTADTEPNAPPRRLDLEDLDLDEHRLMAHASALSDEALLSDRDAGTLVKAPEGYGTKHDRIVAEVNRRMRERKALRLARPPKHNPEQEKILATAKSTLAQKAPLDVGVKNVMQQNLRDRWLTDIENRMARLRSEYDSLGFTWFNRAKRERKRQLEGAMRANQGLIDNLTSDQASTNLEQRLYETAKEDVGMNRDIEETLRRQPEDSAIVEVAADEIVEAPTFRR